MIGGAAGGVAVLVSMPFDTIKTYLQVLTHDASATCHSISRVTCPAVRRHPAPVATCVLQPQTHETAAGLSLGGQVSLFFRTGANMVKRRGPSALFVGMVPRLIQQVSEWFWMHRHSQGMQASFGSSHKCMCTC
jgi:hypothetical protein